MAGRAVTLYLDQTVIDAAKAAATRQGLSLSAYANLRLAPGRRPWPAPVVNLLGSLASEPLEAPEELPWAADSARSGL
ncbi:MAG: hypothetical protein LBE08_01565 [Bifidobacteriaceae bacterium]|jgi:hypothetical protein|nr:hypothetical protein [Bifidobacteriaceae bacterium]